MLLVELPTFVWFTATLLMVLFWIVLLASVWTQSAKPRIRRLKRAFWITFIVRKTYLPTQQLTLRRRLLALMSYLQIVNIVMYAVFVAFVVVFSRLSVRTACALTQHLAPKCVL